MANSKYTYPEFSGGLQQRTNKHIKKPNELVTAGNVDFNKVLGSMVRRDGAQGDAEGYELPLLPADKPVLGAFIARYPTGIELWAANNAVGDATSTIKRWVGPNPTDWENVEIGLLPDAETNFMYDLEEVFVTQYDEANDDFITPFSVDKDHDVSQIRHLQYAPKHRFLIEFNGALYAANAMVGADRYRDRVYKSSGPLGAITFARTAQLDTYAPVTLVDQVPTMTSDSAPIGVASANTEAFGVGFLAFNALDDNNTVTRWATDVLPGWLQYDFGSGNAKVITYYSIQALANAASEVNTNVSPKTWTFEGSNNGSTWTVLDTQTNVPIFANLEKRIYPAANTTAYRYYRIYITANQGSVNTVICELELLTSPSSTKDLTMLLDSVRYIKPGMELDFYAAGTNNKLFGITPTTVDKANDSITFTPYTLNFSPGDVNTGTEIITLSSAAEFPTGRALKFASTIGLPAPLVADTTYYAIYVSPTTIKVATSLANAQLEVGINLTTTGSGTHSIRLSYAVSNKDEVWGRDRKGKLTRYWNVDYRQPEKADWFKLPATFDGANDITGVGKISSRLFIFTENSMTKYDGQNTTPLKNDVGCISHKTICYYDSFMIWLDGKGQVWIRNEEAGETDVISIPVQKTLKRFTQDQLRKASAVCVGYVFKLWLGEDPVTGRQYRLCYNFQSNQWSEEYWIPEMPLQIEYIYNGIVKPHFFDEHGQLWVDEEGDDDNGEVIDFTPELGDDNFGIDEIKKYIGIKVYSDNSAATKVVVSVDKGEPVEVGEITKPVQSIKFNSEKVPTGTLINVKFVNSSSGEPVQIDKAVISYNREEDTFRETQ